MLGDPKHGDVVFVFKRDGREDRLYASKAILSRTSDYFATRNVEIRGHVLIP
jgi:hypothetical protein